MGKKDKIVSAVGILAVIAFFVWIDRANKRDFESDTHDWEDKNSLLQQKVEEYAGALNEANENIKLANQMIKDAKNSSEFGCEKMRITLENLTAVDVVEDPEKPKEKKTNFPYDNDDEPEGIIIDPPPPTIKKSDGGICYEPGTEYYEKLTVIPAYYSLDDCLENGGRLPKK